MSGIRIDKRGPAISINQPTAGPYFLNQSVVASYTCTDGGSGVGSCLGPVSSGETIDTSSPGTKTFTVRAVDAVGNTSSKSVTYSVGYRFSGFLQRVDNPPTVNSGKAGRTYPIKFQLTNASGGFVSALSAVTSLTFQSNSCGAFGGEPVDALETEATGGTVLRYDSTANQYVYNWATPRAPGCYTLQVTLASGQVYSAYFNLTQVTTGACTKGGPSGLPFAAASRCVSANAMALSGCMAAPSAHPVANASASMAVRTWVRSLVRGLIGRVPLGAGASPVRVDGAEKADCSMEVALFRFQCGLRAKRMEITIGSGMPC